MKAFEKGRKRRQQHQTAEKFRHGSLALKGGRVGGGQAMGEGGGVKGQDLGLDSTKMRSSTVAGFIQHSALVQLQSRRPSPYVVYVFKEDPGVVSGFVFFFDVNMHVWRRSWWVGTTQRLHTHGEYRLSEAGVFVERCSDGPRRTESTVDSWILHFVVALGGLKQWEGMWCRVR